MDMTVCSISSLPVRRSPATKSIDIIEILCQNTRRILYIALYQANHRSRLLRCAPKWNWFLQVVDPERNKILILLDCDAHLGQDDLIDLSIVPSLASLDLQDNFLIPRFDPIP